MYPMRNLLLVFGIAAFFAACSNKTESEAPPATDETAEVDEAAGQSMAATAPLPAPVAELTTEWDSTASQIGAFLKELRLNQASLISSLGAGNQEAKAKLSAADRQKAAQLETELKRLSAVYTDLNKAFNSWSENWQLKSAEIANLKTMKPVDPLPESVTTALVTLQKEIDQSRARLSEWQVKLQKTQSQIDAKKQQYDALIKQ